MKSRKYLLLLMLLLPLISYSCKDEITTPNDPPGRRDYVWSVDTLSEFYGGRYGGYRKITGTSLSDIWIAGDVNFSLLHFNGRDWAAINANPPIETGTVFSFGKDSLWFAWREEKIWRIKGNDITQIGECPLPGYTSMLYEDMWSDNNKEVFISGLVYDTTAEEHMYGILLKYENNKFSFMIKPEVRSQFLQVRRDINNPSVLYLIGFNAENFTDNLYKYENNKIEILHSERIWTENAGAYLFYLKGSVFFYFENKIHMRLNDLFIPIVDLNKYNIRNSYVLTGRSLSDIFTCSGNGIVHYNGTDLVQLLDLPEGSIDDAITFNDGVAFIYRITVDGNKTRSLIVRGKLK